MGMKITFPFLSGAARENEMGVRGALNPTIYWVINFLVRIPFVSLSCSAFCPLWQTISQWVFVFCYQNCSDLLKKMC